MWTQFRAFIRGKDKAIITIEKYYNNMGFHIPKIDKF